MQKKIAVLTATRAEYSLLKKLIEKILQEDIFKVELLVTGAHLSPNRGNTIEEILKDGFPIAKKVEILSDSDSPSDISKSMGRAMLGFADYFEEAKPDALLVLGDRYETLAVCLCAMNSCVPIFHLHGGETTEGAIDEAVRHSITKLSYLHFTSTECYRKRVIQLGESPDRVFNVGAIGVENALKEDTVPRDELSEQVGLDLSGPYGVVTFHPVTLAGTEDNQVEELLRAISNQNAFSYIITGTNADCGGNHINQKLQEFAAENDNVCFVESLGMKRYLSALKYCSFVLGNSSSGIIEAPSFHIPTINVGDRQKGRIRAESVIDCRVCEKEIVEAIQLATSPEFGAKIRNIDNPYGDGNTTDRIVEILKDEAVFNKIDLKKKFYDVELGDKI